jgi:hypothetical protein
MIRDPILNLRFPEDREITRYVKEQHDLFVDVHRTEMAALRPTLPARKYSPMRRCTAADVVNGYRLFLHRDPENEAILAQHVDRRAVYLFVRGLLDSDEYSKVYNAGPPPRRPLDPARPCTREDVTHGYQLLMHRDPDADAVFERFVDRVSVLDFCRALLGSKEFSEIVGRIVP